MQSMEWSGRCWHKKSTREIQPVPRTLRGDRSVTNNVRSTEISAMDSVSTGHLVGNTTATVKSILAAPSRTRNVTTVSSSPTQKRKITTTTISSPNRNTKRKMFVETGLALDPIQIDILTQVSSHCSELIESLSTLNISLTSTSISSPLGHYTVAFCVVNATALACR